MKCQVCQYDMPAGTPFCTNCGTPMSAPGGSSPNQGIAPTMLASTPPPANPYGVPGPEITNPPSPYANPYGAPPAAPSNPYGASASPYGTPPANPYGVPGSAPAYTPGVVGAPAYGQPYAQPAKKKGPNGCVIAIIVVVALFVLIVGGIIAAVAVVANNVKNAVSNIPSISQIATSASSNLSNAQTSSSVDADAKPTNVTTSFTKDSTIYVTYDLAGNAGYVIEKTYDSSGNLVLKTTTPHAIQKDYTNGYISFSLPDAGSYTTAVYWCGKSDCSDAALAAVVAYTVS